MSASLEIQLIWAQEITFFQTLGSTFVSLCSSINASWFSLWWEITSRYYMKQREVLSQPIIQPRTLILSEMTSRFLFYSVSSFVDPFTLSWRQTPTWSSMPLMYAKDSFISDLEKKKKIRVKIRIEFFKNIPRHHLPFTSYRKKSSKKKVSIKVNSTVGKLFLSKIVLLVYYF